jgi:hypothetical protein
VPIIGHKYLIKPDAKAICLKAWGSDEWSETYMSPCCGKRVEYLGKYNDNNSNFQTGAIFCYFHNSAIDWEEGDKQSEGKDVVRYYPSSIGG